MGNKRSLIITIISMILLFVVVGVGYKYIVKDYKDSGRLNEKIDDISKDSEKEVATDFIVYNEAGDKVQLSQFIGKPVVINFWASWCGPCQYEMPYFDEAIKKYSKDDIEILMINVTDGKRETREDAQELIKNNNYEMDILFDDKMDASKAYNIQGIPRSIFIDKDGFVVYDHTGVIDEEILNIKIEELIK